MCLVGTCNQFKPCNLPHRWEREIDERNRALSDEELDAMFPPGYKVLPPPAGYSLSGANDVRTALVLDFHGWGGDGSGQQFRYRVIRVV